MIHEKGSNTDESINSAINTRISMVLLVAFVNQFLNYQLGLLNIYSMLLGLQQTTVELNPH